MRLHILLVGTSFIVAGTVAQADSTWLTDFEKAKQEAQRQNRPLLVHFHAEWCVPCQKMEREVLNSEHVAKSINEKLVAVKLDVDANEALAARFGVDQLPTDVIVEPTGKQLLESSGFHPADEYTTDIIGRGVRKYEDLMAERARKKAELEQKLANARANGDTQDSTAEPVAQTKRLMLDGYCPVTLWTNRRWEKGSPDYTVEYRGQSYHMASAEQMVLFQENPARYAPRFMGCDAVVARESDRAVQGSTRFSAFYDDELYMFTSDEHRTRFKAAPDQFTRINTVFNVDDIELTTTR